MKIVYRTDYMDNLGNIKNTPDIKVITGIRRSGKSELMKMFIQEIRENERQSNVVYADLTLLENEILLDYHRLYEWAKSSYVEGKTNYLLIDEVQLCKHFELAINSLYSLRIFDIYLTGSNAFLLSSDLATLFTGRYIEIHVLPFSFSEYCKYMDDAEDLQILFDRYTVDGGMSGSYVYRTEQDKNAYLKGIYQTILKRDLVERNKLPDSGALSSVSEFMMDNVGNVTTTNSISNCLSAHHTTIGSYIKYLTDAFLFYKVKRYDIRGKKYLQSLDKYYIVDVGLRYAILGRRNMDYGRVYENMVAMELVRRGYEIYVGKLYQKEVDFVAINGNDKIYVQVSDNIAEATTFQREVEPLLAIRDAYPKLLLARTKHPMYDYQGIQVIDIAQWLKGSIEK